MKKIVFISLLVAVNYAAAASNASFIACKSRYALCTTAMCTPIAGKKGLVACTCDVTTGYSAGAKQCQLKDRGSLIYSRYYPIKSYVKCVNNRPWAWCLDSPCTVDKHNPAKARCLCSVVKAKGDYIIVTNKYTKNICNTGMYSSALISQVDQISSFLRGDSKLQPFPIRVIGPS